MKAIKEAIQKMATMGSLPASLQSMLEAALREDEGRKFCDCNQGRLPCTCKPAEQHQGEPVAWVIETEDGRGADYYIGKGLDTLEPGTKLYTQADPAEVERLRAQLATETARADAAVGDANEADALLHAIATRPDLPKVVRNWLDEAVGSSAEPIVTFTGDDITEGRDLLGKGLGYVIEQQVISEMERDESTGSRHYYCGKVKVVLGHGSYAICGQIGPGGLLQCKDCADMERKP